MRSKASLAPDKRLVLKPLCLLFLPLLLSAQQNKLTVTPATQVVIKRGESTTATLKVVTLPGFHVNSNKPGGQFTLPLQLSWDSGPLQPHFVHYPQAEKITVGTETLNVFTGTFTIQTELQAPPNASSGSTAITGKLHYQACNNLMCFRPSTIEVRVPVLIE